MRLFLEQHMDNISTNPAAALAAARLGEPVAGLTQNIGAGFTARQFSDEMFEGRMDPLLMVDHFVMTAPTFAPHLHAGISAVTAIFEDARGVFRNRDSLGNDVGLRAGDLYWLAAGSGAVHEERPEAGGRTHALQIFVDLPAGMKMAPARTWHVLASDVPIIEADGARVRVVLESSDTAGGAPGTPEGMTLLDGRLQPQARFKHALAQGRQAWIYAVSGDLTVRCGDTQRRLAAGSALAVAKGAATDIVLAGADALAESHFVLIAAMPIRKPFDALELP
jgi:redox-sensitive bicupin YhaK (pirin superfamily)